MGRSEGQDGFRAPYMLTRQALALPACDCRDRQLACIPRDSGPRPGWVILGADLHAGPGSFPNNRALGARLGCALRRGARCRFVESDGLVQLRQRRRAGVRAKEPISGQPDHSLCSGFSRVLPLPSPNVMDAVRIGV